MNGVDGLKQSIIVGPPVVTVETEGMSDDVRRCLVDKLEVACKKVNRSIVLGDYWPHRQIVVYLPWGRLDMEAVYAACAAVANEFVATETATNTAQSCHLASLADSSALQLH